MFMCQLNYKMFHPYQFIWNIAMQMPRNVFSIEVQSVLGKALLLGFLSAPTFNTVSWWPSSVSTNRSPFSSILPVSSFSANTNEFLNFGINKLSDQQKSRHLKLLGSSHFLAEAQLLGQCTQIGQMIHQAELAGHLPIAASVLLHSSNESASSPTLLPSAAAAVAGWLLLSRWAAILKIAVEEVGQAE
jgi:hypothetical protein